MTAPAFAPFTYRRNLDYLRRHRFAFWIDRPSTVCGVTGLAPVADVRNIGPGSERLAVLLSAAPELESALRDCVASLEAAGADGEPGAMPSPALDRARLLLGRLDGAA